MRNNKKSLTAVFALVLALLMAVTALTFAEETERPDVKAIVNTTTDKTKTVTPFTDVIADVKNSVVGVNNYQTYTYSNRNNGFSFGFGFGFDFGYGDRNDDEGQAKTEERLAGTGSGVVIYDEYVLTNYHVVEDSTRVTVSTLLDDEEHAGEVVGFDEGVDIAIIHVPGLGIPAVEMGDSDQMQVGEWAICIGNPLSEKLAGTVTMGIVSALDREVSSTTTTDKYGLKTTVSNAMIQTNAQINAGNSGGGLFNILGQLQGIPTLKYSGTLYSGSTVEGIGMAIPINAAKPLIEEVIGGKKTASIKLDAAEKDTEEDDEGDGKPRLGVTIYAISANNNYAVNQGVLPNGVMIDTVEEKSPAETAGLMPYDVIVEVDGTIITGIADLTTQLEDKKAGDTLNIKVYRVPDLDKAEYVSDIGEGSYLDIPVTLTDFH